MCFGGNQAPAIQQPQVIYRGPSDDDIRRQEEGLATFQQQIKRQIKLLLLKVLPTQRFLMHE